MEAKLRAKRRVMEKITKTDAEWRQELPPETYKVMRQAGTERPFSGAEAPKGPGVYKCAACGLELFDAAAKFNSGTGWPSFTAPIRAEAVEEEDDVSYGMRRTEVLCARCEGHLGHVFPDGPQPTGQRYCINAVALQFEKESDAT